MKVSHYGKTIAQDRYLSTPPVSKSTFGSCLCNWLSITTFDQSQLLKCMKIIAFLLFICSMQVSANSYGQETVTLSIKNSPITKIFSAIEKHTAYTFMFESKLAENPKLFTITVKKQPIDSVLTLLFGDQQITYEIVDKSIIIRLKTNSNSSEINVKDSLKLEVTGRVLTKSGEPIPGASVTIQGDSKKTITDAKGEFTFRDIQENSIISISSIGYETKFIKINGQSFLTVVLSIKVNILDETLVIAYGNTTKRLNTGNISSVKGKDINKQPVDNFLLALQGRVPGLTIIQSTGVPGGGIKVRVQGQNSLSRGNDPLYVIDGVPFMSQLPQGLTSPSGILGDNGNSNTFSSDGVASPFSFINPSDIESIEVLKDADATSIYGSRAAAGAILITTKKGKNNKIKSELNVQYGIGKINQRLKLLNTKQYLEIRKEAKNNDGAPILQSDFDINGTWDSTRQTDWQKELLGGTSKILNATLAISGGNQTTSFVVSPGFRKEGSVFPGSLYDLKGSMHLNLSHTSIDKRFQFQITTNYSSTKTNLIRTDLTQTAISLAPNAPKLYNEDGSLNWARLSNGSSTWYNPLAYLDRKFERNLTNLIANSIIKFEIVPGLAFTTNLGYTRTLIDEKALQPSTSNAPEDRIATPRSSQFSSSDVNSWIVEPQLSYTKEINKNKISILIGSTFQKTKSNTQRIEGSGYISDLSISDIKSAPSIVVAQNRYSLYSYSAIFGRVTFDHQNKYIVSINARKDGSSRFGSENLFQNFASIGAGWIFTNESFLKENQRVLSYGKIRASYGTTGNDQIGDYQFMNLYNTLNVATPYQGTISLSPNGIPNQYLQWEETKKLQFGLEFGLFSDKILATINYYRNRSTNQLQQYLLPNLTGFSNIQKNIPAKIENTGWELDLESRIITGKNFIWTSSANITIPRNKLISYPNIENSAVKTQYTISQSFGAGKSYSLIGVDPQTGLFSFINSKGDKTSEPSNPTDLIIQNQGTPKFYGGLQNNLKYKNFELNLLFQFTKQYGTNYTVGNFPGMFFSNNSGIIRANQPTSILERWQNLNDERKIQKLSSTYPGTISSPYIASMISNLTFSDASFIRLKNVTLSWNIPINKKNNYIQQIKAYLQSHNLITISNYVGLDPETQSLTNVPPLRHFTLGFEFIF